MLGIQKPEKDELNRLLKASNDAAAIFDLPLLYSKGGFAAGGGHVRTEEGNRPEPDRARVTGLETDDCSEAFHVSIAWSLEAPGEDMVDPMEHREVAVLMEKTIGKIPVEFDVVKVKIGNAVHAVDLAKKQTHNVKGILG